MPKCEKWVFTVYICSVCSSLYYPVFIYKFSAYVHSLELKSRAEWRKLCATDKLPENIPQSPRRVYKQEVWT